jgi:hypothetical protein
MMYVINCKASVWACTNNNLVFFVTETKTALLVDINISLAYNFSNAAAERITKYENLAVLGIRNICKLNNMSVYPLGISAEGHQRLPKTYKNYRFK